jgi:Family of unknown function (DUF6508)
MSGTAEPDADDRFMSEMSDDIAAFAVPSTTWKGGQRLDDGSIQMPWCEYDEAGERLMKFAYHGAYDWAHDPKRADQNAMLESLTTGAPDDSVHGETDELWHCLFAVVRSERFCEGAVAAHALALTRIANELRRRLLDQRASGAS